jgi:glucose-6-phosphate isomerase
MFLSMRSRHALKVDLNHLFKPAIVDGPKGTAAFEAVFGEAHAAISALKKTGQLPFSALPDNKPILDELLSKAAKYKSVKNVVVFGIGGSALGAASIYHALKGSHAHLMGRAKNEARLFVVDNIDVTTMQDTFEVIKGEKTLFIFITKSGNTPETLAQYLYVQAHYPDLKQEDVFIITDANEGCFREIADEQGITSLDIPVGVGGRFSVFSPAGLFPLALCGVDVTALLEGASHVEKQSRMAVLPQNPSALLAMALHYWTVDKSFSQIVMMPYSDRLRLFGDWFAQLWAESLGKANSLDEQKINLGSTALKAVGVTDQHSQLQLYLDGPRDKVVGFIEVEDAGALGTLSDTPLGDERIDFLNGKNLQSLLSTELQATETCLCEKQRPNFLISLPVINEYQLGQLYQMWMNVIPYIGTLMGINAFDQPAVEQIKNYTFSLMGRKGYEDSLLKLRSFKKKDDLVF